MSKVVYGLTGREAAYPDFFHHKIEVQNRGVDDVLTEVLRQGAHRLLRESVEAEVNTFLAGYAERRDEAGRRQLVRNGYLPERQVQTGIGSVKVKVPRVRDRSRSGSALLGRIQNSCECGT